MANRLNRGAFMPTWLFYCLIRPVLPKSHPWKAPMITLEDWRRSETSLCKDFDDAFRIIGVSILVFTFVYLLVFFSL